MPKSLTWLLMKDLVCLHLQQTNWNKLRNQHKKYLQLSMMLLNESKLFEKKCPRCIVCDFARFLSFANYTGIVCLQKQGNKNNAQVFWLDWRNKMAVVYKLRRLYKSVEKDENFSKFGNQWVSELWKFIESQLHLMGSWICNLVHRV